jgi:hypothetical protein
MARRTRGTPARLGGYVRRHHLALIALFLALGGTSYAAVTAGRSQAPAPLASGQTIRGTWSIVVGSGAAGQMVFGSDAVTFQIPAPVRVDGHHVVLAGNDTVTGDGCTGSAQHPIAARGFVCAYFDHALKTTSGSGVGVPGGHTDGVGDGSRYGFEVVINGTSPFVADGTWAYTAP